MIRQLSESRMPVRFWACVWLCLTLLVGAGCAADTSPTEATMPTRSVQTPALTTPVPSPELTNAAAPPTPVPPATSTPVPTAAPELSTVVTTSTINATMAPSPTAAALTPVPSVAAGVGPWSLTTVGYSVNGYPIEAYRIGEGARHLMVVGGIHGGYEWNSITLAYELFDYFTAQPEMIPDAVTLTIIPSANPDGQVLVAGQAGRPPAGLPGDAIGGRFNGNFVDLNRNWDCEWSPVAYWRNEEISGGASVFSEPETQALKQFFETERPAAVIFLHSAFDAVFAAGCGETHQPSYALGEVYSKAAGYPLYEQFFSYPITGDVGDWLTTVGIPSITVELKNHFDTDWEQNRRGILAVLDYYEQAAAGFPVENQQ